jgi:hypothetical protein
MDEHADPGERGIEASLKATYRALLARGLQAGEAANLTAFLHGLPSVGVQWTLPEIEAIISRRIAHAADERAAAGLEALSERDARRAAVDRHPNHPSRRGSTIHDRRRFRTGSTHVIDPPTP